MILRLLTFFKSVSKSDYLRNLNVYCALNVGDYYKIRAATFLHFLPPKGQFKSKCIEENNTKGV